MKVYLKRIILILIVALCIWNIVTFTLKLENAIVIDRVTPDKIVANEKFFETDGVSTMGVYGEKIHPGDIIYINNEPQETTYGSEEWLTCFVPDEYYAKKGKLKVQVKRINDNGKVEEYSNKITVYIR